jgi:hypothetical protein
MGHCRVYPRNGKVYVFQLTTKYHLKSERIKRLKLGNDLFSRQWLDLRELVIVQFILISLSWFINLSSLHKVSFFQQRGILLLFP